MRYKKINNNIIAYYNPRLIVKSLKSNEYFDCIDLISKDEIKGFKLVNFWDRLDFFVSSIITFHDLSSYAKLLIDITESDERIIKDFKSDDFKLNEYVKKACKTPQIWSAGCYPSSCDFVKIHSYLKNMEYKIEDIRPKIVNFMKNGNWDKA